MECKRDLTQIALTALILASTAINAQIEQDNSAQDLFSDSCARTHTFLAVGCAAHGCPSPTKNVASDNGKSDHSYPTGNNSQGYETNGYPIGDHPKGNNPHDNYDTRSPSMYPNPNQPPKETNKGKKPEELSYMTTPERAYSDSSYNSQRSGMTSPVYVEDYRLNTFESLPSPYPEYGAMTGFNREYNTTSDYDYNRASVSTVTQSPYTLTEAQLLGMLTSQGRNIYLNLDPEGKSLAIQLASQESYRDKNLAVKEAQRRMNERRGLMYR